jgi:predicted MPP superfamily phosphohydrolase
VVVLFNWAFGAIVLLALLQLALDVGLLVGLLIHGGIVSAPDGVRYGLAAVATVAAAVGVHQAMRIPPLKDIEVGIHGLPRQFDGYTILQLTDTGHLVRDLAAVLEGAPKGAPVILLDHQPSDARNAAKLGVALQLSGHTHGRLILGIDRLAARANAGYVSGRYDVDGMTLYVNNGTGLWPGFALRLGRPSELTRITLRQAVAT